MADSWKHTDIVIGYGYHPARWLVDCVTMDTVAGSSSLLQTYHVEKLTDEQISGKFIFSTLILLTIALINWHLLFIIHWIWICNFNK